MTAEKATPYESGSESTGANHIKLSIKFYLTAILFVVFDIEAIFLYPWASMFRELGWVGFGERKPAQECGFHLLRLLYASETRPVLSPKRGSEAPTRSSIESQRFVTGTPS